MRGSGKSFTFKLKAGGSRGDRGPRRSTGPAPACSPFLRALREERSQALCPAPGPGERGKAAASPASSLVAWLLFPVPGQLPPPSALWVPLLPPGGDSGPSHVSHCRPAELLGLDAGSTHEQRLSASLTPLSLPSLPSQFSRSPSGGNRKPGWGLAEDGAGRPHRCSPPSSWPPAWAAACPGRVLALADGRGSPGLQGCKGGGTSSA